jgi:hypothetical protein
MYVSRNWTWRHFLPFLEREMCLKNLAGVDNQHWLCVKKNLIFWPKISTYVSCIFTSCKNASSQVEEEYFLQTKYFLPDRKINEVLHQQLRVEFFIHNCYVCLNGNKLTRFFDSPPPKLSDYLARWLLLLITYYVLFRSIKVLFKKCSNSSNFNTVIIIRHEHQYALAIYIIIWCSSLPYHYMARASFTIIYDAFFLTPTTFTADQADEARNDLMVSLSNISTTITSCQSTLLWAYERSKHNTGIHGSGRIDDHTKLSICAANECCINTTQWWKE